MDLFVASLISLVWIFGMPTPHMADYWAKDLIVFILGAGWFAILQKYLREREIKKVNRV